jgi:hypothetical protein
MLVSVGADDDEPEDIDCQGGCWLNQAQNLRAAYRNRNPARNRNQNRGFRVCVAPANTETPNDNDREGHGAGADRASSRRRISSGSPLLVGIDRASGRATSPLFSR